MENVPGKDWGVLVQLALYARRPQAGSSIIDGTFTLAEVRRRAVLWQHITLP